MHIVIVSDIEVVLLPSYHYNVPFPSIKLLVKGNTNGNGLVVDQNSND